MAFVITFITVSLSSSVGYGQPIPLRSVGSVSLDPANFTHPVSNPYFPLTPGTTYFYQAEDEDGLSRTEVSITSARKTIEGVSAVVVHDVSWLDVTDGPTVLIENTFDWFAPDNFGNVWYLGESTVEHLYDDNWKPIGTSTEGSWQAGVDGAEAGLIMLANPRAGLSYRQEFAAGVAEDMAKVERLNARISVPYGDFTNGLVTKEWTALEPGTIERKYYVAGLGLVLTKEFHGKGTVREELVAVTSVAR
jgi:hypothetical protein